MAGMDFVEFLRQSPPLPAAVPAAVPVPVPQRVGIPPATIVDRRVVPSIDAIKKSAGANNLNKEDLIAGIEALMNKFGPDQNEIPERPVFDLSSIAPPKMPMPDMPLDIRPIAAMMDSIYGTKTYEKTANLPAETLAKAQALQNLNQGSNALLQTQAQAKLAEFNKKLEHYYNLKGQQSPAQIAQTVRDYAKVLTGGGDSGDLKTMIQLMGMQNANDNAFNANKFEVEKFKRAKADELTQDLMKSEAVRSYNKITNTGKSVRAALYNKRFTGIGDYGTVIGYIKSLDPDSTVMFSEAQALGQAQGLYAKFGNYLKRMQDPSQGELSEEAKKDIGRLINEYQRFAKDYLDRQVELTRDRARTQGLPPEDIVSGVVKSTTIAPDYFMFANYDKNGKPILNKDGTPETFRVRDDKVEIFKEKYPNTRPVNLKK
jgi:hypothetical protein